MAKNKLRCSVSDGAKTVDFFVQADRTKRISNGGRSNRFCLVLVAALMSFTSAGWAQDEATAPRIDYTKSILPILETKCTTCHNANDEEGGLDLSDLDQLNEYIVAEKPLASGLYHSITGTNDLSLMPPEEDNDGNPLTPLTDAELALVYLWIQQGASLEGAPVEEKPEETRSTVTRVFLFSGYFHPAMVHFPIALITISAFFIIFCFRNDSLSDDAAFYLLLLGTLFAIMASVVGWAFAERNPVDISDFSLNINRHRWIGIATTVLALVSTILGWRARNEVIGNRSGIWKFGVVLTAALIGLVGHQGGEEVYGEGMYERAAEKLIPELWPFKRDNDEGGDVADENKNAAGKNNGAKEKNEPESDVNENPNPKGEQKNDPDDAGKTDPEKGDSNSPAEVKDIPPVDPTIKSK